MARPIRLLLVDDHRLLRESIRKLLAEEPGLEIVDEAADGRRALKLAVQKRPDVVLLDIEMSELNGVDVIRQLAREVPETKALVLSMHAADSYVIEALRAGAKGYLLKSSTGDELKAAVRAVAGGDSYFSPQVGAILARHVRISDEEPAMSPLTTREREVLQLIAEGKTLREVAQTLSVSAKTAKNHRDHIAAKLGAHSTAALVKHAIRLRLTTG